MSTLLLALLLVATPVERARVPAAQAQWDELYLAYLSGPVTAYREPDGWSSRGCCCEEPVWLNAGLAEYVEWRYLGSEGPPVALARARRGGRRAGCPRWHR